MTQEEKTYLKKLREAGYSRQEIICSLVSDILGKSCSIKETEDYLRTLQQRGMDGEQILSYLVAQKLQKEIPSNETEGLLAPVPAMNKLALVSLCGGIYTTVLTASFPTGMIVPAFYFSLSGVLYAGRKWLEYRANHVDQEKNQMNEKTKIMYR